MFLQFHGSHLEPPPPPSCILFVCQKYVGKDMSGNNSIFVGRVWPFLGT